MKELVNKLLACESIACQMDIIEPIILADGNKAITLKEEVLVQFQNGWITGMPYSVQTPEVRSLNQLGGTIEYLLEKNGIVL